MRVLQEIKGNLNDERFRSTERWLDIPVELKKQGVAMALFGLFKSKSEREFDASMKQMFEMVNPLGEAGLQYDCRRVAPLVHNKLAEDKLRGFVAGSKALIVMDENYTDERLIESFVARSGGVLSASEAWDVYVYLAGEAGIRDNMARIMEAPSLSPSLIAETEMIGKVWQRGTTQDTIPGGYGEFGLVVTNPIPVVCISASGKYLARLRWGGRPVDNHRVGSTSSDAIEGKIDMYSVKTGGRDLAAIYICPYHRRNSRMAPRGFTLS